MAGSGFDFNRRCGSEPRKGASPKSKRGAQHELILSVGSKGKGNAFPLFGIADQSEDNES